MNAREEEIFNYCSNDELQKLDNLEFRQRIAALSPNEIRIAMEILVTSQPVIYCDVLRTYMENQARYINDLERLVKDRATSIMKLYGEQPEGDELS